MKKEKEKKQNMKVPVSERALIQRINRKFRSEDGPPARELKKTKGARAKQELGYFYVLNTERNFIDEHHVDPEALGRELGVVSESEEWCEDEE
jgi:hypothetical protein